jgi:hypothetical protein
VIRVSQPLEQLLESRIVPDVLEERHARNAQPTVTPDDSLVEQLERAVGLAETRVNDRPIERADVFGGSARLELAQAVPRFVVASRSSERPRQPAKIERRPAGKRGRSRQYADGFVVYFAGAGIATPAPLGARRDARSPTAIAAAMSAISALP